MRPRKRFNVDDLWTERDGLPTAAVLRAIAARCADVWDMPDLPTKVRISYNPRMRTTLGRAFLSEGIVELNTRLLQKHPSELVPTLAHELAHVAVHLRYGTVAPHGQEFRTLMHALSLSDKATHDLPVARMRQRRRTYLYVHRCSDCGSTFVARKVRRDCYCRACGPEMNWTVLRVPNTPEGRARLAELL